MSNQASNPTVQHIGKYLCESNQRKKNVMITLSPSLLAQARAYKINLSKLLESSLINAFTPNPQAFSLSEGSLFKKRKFAPVAQPVEQRFRKPSLVEWERFKAYLLGKHRKRWASELYRLARQHHESNLSVLGSFSRSKQAKVMQALIALAKFNGTYEEFKAHAKSYGFKWKKPSTLDAFRRMRENTNHDVLEWLNQTETILDEDQRLFSEFALVSGLRTSEAIESFNLIIRLHSEGKLEEYYNKAQATLEHFAFPEKFLRNTKNAFITIVPQDMIDRVSRAKPITYDSLKGKLQRKRIGLRFDELRDYFGTFMVHNGLIKEEVDLLQGRIGESIFTRHYFSPSFTELRDRTLKAIKKLRSQA